MVLADKAVQSAEPQAELSGNLHELDVESVVSGERGQLAEENHENSMLAC